MTIRKPTLGETNFIFPQEGFDERKGISIQWRDLNP